MGSKMLFHKNKKKLKKTSENEWKILVADDNEDVHKITKLILNNKDLEGRKIKIINCYSGEETKKVIESMRDIAILFLDVVMESEDSGLEVVKYVREKLHNNKTRIILRTGQPGQAPEERVIRDYDINDYKNKTELTSQRLITTTISALRAYRDLDVMEQSKKGLEKIIKSTTDVYAKENLRSFSDRVMENLLRIFGDRSEDDLEGYIATKSSNGYRLLSGLGDLKSKSGEMIQIPKKEILEKEKSENLIKCSFFEISNGDKICCYVKKDRGFNLIENYLFGIFIYIIKVNFENIELIQKKNQIMEELEEEMKKSEIALRIKEDFLSNMSHELRTPLTGLIGGIDLLPSDFEKENEKLVSILKDSTYRLEDLIEKLLLHNNLANEDYSIRESKFKFSELIKDVRDLLKIPIQKSNAKVKMSIDKAVNNKVYTGDQLKIVHIIYFLMENALKFTPDGEILVKIEESNNNYITIIVSDTGIGMKEEVAKRAFEAFYQGEHHMTKVYAGTGISLKIVKELVEAIGGNIDFTTKEGTGTTFKVRIPLFCK
ncbi:MAG: ATP-binding protein [Fusobacteriota bacterium]